MVGRARGDGSECAKLKKEGTARIAEGPRNDNGKCVSKCNAYREIVFTGLLTQYSDTYWNR